MMYANSNSISKDILPNEDNFNLVLSDDFVEPSIHKHNL